LETLVLPLHYCDMVQATGFEPVKPKGARFTV
jgi:hypothetical protein